MTINRFKTRVFINSRYKTKIDNDESGLDFTRNRQWPKQRKVENKRNTDRLVKKGFSFNYKQNNIYDVFNSFIEDAVIENNCQKETEKITEDIKLSKTRSKRRKKVTKAKRRDLAISAIMPQSLPMLRVNCLTGSVSALIDSGSAGNLISFKAFETLKKSCRDIKLSSDDSIIRSADSSNLDCLGSTSLKIKVGNFAWYVRFLIVNKLAMPMILGVTFISRTGLVLNLSKDICWFKFNLNRKFKILRGVWFCEGAKRPKFGAEISNAIDGSGDKESKVDFLDHLVGIERNEIQRVIDSYPDVLTKSLGKTNILEYDIELTDTTPIRRPPYRLAPPKLKIMKGLIQEMLDSGVIRTSKSNYSSPIFLVPKGEDKYRTVIDYRLLNSKIVIDSVPIPDLHTSFAHFTGAKIFSSIDLNEAYFPIPLSERPKKLTAFCTDWNLYEFNRVPFGLAIGAQVLCQLLDQIFGDIKFNYVYHYLDDVVVYSKSFSEHVLHLKEVFRRLREAGLTVNPEKVHLAVEKLSFLGHIVTEKGVSIDPSRTCAIRDFPPPKDCKGIARFLGMVNFFNKFIPNLAKIAAPLNQLRKKGEKFVWNECCQQAFSKLKDCISNPPVLAMPDFSQKFVIQTDASTVAVGGVLLQEFPEGRRPIAYASRTLNKLERKYSVYELEGLAVLFSVERFRMFIEHVEFLLETDCQALSWVLGSPRKIGRIARWGIRLSAFKFKARHIRGTENSVADALSRMFDVNDDLRVDEKEEAEIQKDDFNICAILSELPFAFHCLQKSQRTDEHLGPIIEEFEKGNKVKGFLFKKGVLYNQGRKGMRLKIILPNDLIDVVFAYFHESAVGGHLGVEKTKCKIAENFYWKNLEKDVKERIKGCVICSRSKPSQNQRIGFLSSEVPSGPLDKLYIDYVGRFPRSKSGNQYIFVAVCGYTKFTWLFPTRDSTTKITIECLKRIFSVVGFARCVVSDNASYFVSNGFKRFCFDLGIRHITTSVYYPSPNLSERVNRNLRAALIAFHSSDHANWDSQLYWLQFAFNSARHEATKVAPISLFLGFSPNNPLSNLWEIKDLLPDPKNAYQVKDQWKRVANNLKLSHETMLRRYNDKRKHVQFKVGDKVFVRNFPKSNARQKFAAKLAPKFLGPLTLHKFLTPVTVELKDEETGRLYRHHVSHVKT